MAMRFLTAQQCSDLLAEDGRALHIDVRSQEEFAAGHAEGAVNIPIAEPNSHGEMEMVPEFKQAVEALAPQRDTPLVFS